MVKRWLSTFVEQPSQAALTVVAERLRLRMRCQHVVGEERGRVLRIGGCGSRTGANGDRVQRASISRAHGCWALRQHGAIGPALSTRIAQIGLLLTLLKANGSFKRHASSAHDRRSVSNGRCNSLSAHRLGARRPAAAPACRTRRARVAYRRWLPRLLARRFSAQESARASFFH